MWKSSGLSHAQRVTAGNVLKEFLCELDRRAKNGTATTKSRDVTKRTLWRFTAGFFMFLAARIPNIKHRPVSVITQRVRKHTQLNQANVVAGLSVCLKRLGYGHFECKLGPMICHLNVRCIEGSITLFPLLDYLARQLPKRVREHRGSSRAVTVCTRGPC